MSKKALIAAIAVCTLFATLLTPTTTFAQTIPTPSVPTFTVQPEGPTFVINTTYSLDPNTGQIVPKLGYTNQYSGLKIIIENQAFTPYNDSSGNFVTLYYNVRLKSHNETSWYALFDPDACDAPVSISTTSDYTNVTYSWNSGPDSPIPVGTPQVDVQVDAYIGSIHKEPAGNIYGFAWVFTGQKSNWSDTQTIALPANVPLSLPTQSPTPTASTQTPTASAIASPVVTPSPQVIVESVPTWFYLIISALVAVIAVLLGVIVSMQRRKTIQVRG